MLFTFAQGGQEKARKNCDDRNDHEQLDEREAKPLVAISRSHNVLHYQLGGWDVKEAFQGTVRIPTISVALKRVQYNGLPLP
jgi:hypothetical protein